MFYINCYFFFAILGFLFESIFFILIKKSYNSSILFGPWTPIYGIAFFIIYFINKLVKKWHLNKVLEIIIFFLLNIVVLSLLEFISGELILATNHVRYWNYINNHFNIDGFICLEVSMFWGVLSLFVNYILYPHVKRFLKNIPRFITIILIILYVIDNIFTLFDIKKGLITFFLIVFI